MVHDVRDGNGAGVSSDVINSVARALQLSPGERVHLESLISRISMQSQFVVVDPLVLEALDRWIDAPAYVINRTWDAIAWNEAYSYVWGIEDPGGAPFNIMLRYFIDEKMRARFTTTGLHLLARLSLCFACLGRVI